MKLLDNYKEALEALYEHVGFEEDYVIYPIDDRTNMYWDFSTEEVKYAETIKKMESNGDYYLDEIYKQRFYSKWVYEGKELTMIFCDPGVDGMKYFAIFNNKKRIKNSI